MSRHGVALGLLAALAVAAVLDTWGHVDLRVYAYNQSDAAAEAHVLVLRDGRPAFDHSAQVPAGGDALLGHVRGPPGRYVWAVEFGGAAATGSEEWERSHGPLSAILLPGGEVEVSVAIA